MAGIEFAGLRLLSSEVKIQLDGEPKKLAMFSSGQTLETGSAADAVGDRLMMTEGDYLVFVQGALRCSAAQDICLRIVAGGDSRFCGPQTTVALAGANDLRNLVMAVNGAFHTNEKLPMPASRVARPFAFFGVVTIPEPTPIDLWGHFISENDMLPSFGGSKSPVTFTSCELLALQLNEKENS